MGPNDVNLEDSTTFGNAFAMGLEVSMYVHAVYDK